MCILHERGILLICKLQVYKFGVEKSGFYLGHENAKKQFETCEDICRSLETI